MSPETISFSLFVGSPTEEVGTNDGGVPADKVASKYPETLWMPLESVGSE